MEKLDSILSPTMPTNISMDVESEIDAYMSDSDPRHLPYDDSRYQIAATYLPRSGCFRVHDSGRVRDFSETEDSYQFLHTFTGKEVRDLLTTSNGRYDPSLRRVVFPSIDRKSVV